MYCVDKPGHDAYMQDYGRPRVQHVYEQAPPIYACRPPLVQYVHHQLPPRIVNVATKKKKLEYILLLETVYVL